ncbi:MAG: Uma2 family endonuclease [Planctomycetota bacterium]
MDWSEIIDNPHLQDLPFKIEQDRYGNVLMSPASNWHGRIQNRIARKLEATLAGGECITECSVQTPEGVKAPDVVWQSSSHYARHGDATPMPEAPEICVEMLSPSNSAAEIELKRRLYFDAGAREVWLCHADGRMEFFLPGGRAERSAAAPEFPLSVA